MCLGLLITYVALALVVSFVCSNLEAVLLSVTPAHLAVLVKQQHPAAALLLQLRMVRVRDIMTPAEHVRSLPRRHHGGRHGDAARTRDLR